MAQIEKEASFHPSHEIRHICGCEISIKLLTCFTLLFIDSFVGMNCSDCVSTCTGMFYSNFTTPASVWQMLHFHKLCCNVLKICAPWAKLCHDQYIGEGKALSLTDISRSLQRMDTPPPSPANQNIKPWPKNLVSALAKLLQAERRRCLQVLHQMSVLL